MMRSDPHSFFLGPMQALYVVGNGGARAQFTDATTPPLMMSGQASLGAA